MCAQSKLSCKIKVDTDDVKENFLQTIISACSRDLTVTQQKNLISIFTQKDNKIIELNGIKLENILPLFILKYL